MILLIRKEICFHVDSICYLNSIMILLILNVILSFTISGKKHLNSIMILLIPITILSASALYLFKFHYDSINSVFLEVDYIILLLNLNSIMILLILTFSSVCSIFRSAFKFHYDSINSRPKIIPLFKPKNVSILSTSSKFNISFLSLIIYFCNTSYFRRFRLLSIPYIFCTIMGRQKHPNFSS